MAGRDRDFVKSKIRQGREQSPLSDPERARLIPIILKRVEEERERQLAVLKQTQELLKRNPQARPFQISRVSPEEAAARQKEFEGFDEFLDEVRHGKRN